MKRVSMLVTSLVLMTALAQAGDMAHSGSFGIQTSLGVASSPVYGTTTIGAKFFVSHNMAFRVEAGFASVSPASGGSRSGYAIGGGFEFHLTSVGSVSPYVGLQVGFGGGSVTTSVPVGGTAPSTPTLLGVTGVFGGEYFFSGNFSWAGELGFGFTSLTNQPAGTAANPNATGSTTTLGTGSAIFILTWYFN